MNEWKTIESAPRDRPILVCNKRHEEHKPIVAKWIGGTFCSIPATFPWVATHWCEIPEFKPTQEETDE